MADALTTHMENVARIVNDMRILQKTCRDRIDLAYRLGKLSDKLELEGHNYLMALGAEAMTKRLKDKGVLA
jgi:hypothetical protein